MRHALLALALLGCPVPELPVNDLRVDQDGDGLSVMDGDCDDDPTTGPSVQTTSTGYADADGDGIGAGAPQTVEACELPAELAPVDGDCDDADDTVQETRPQYRDVDDDGYGAGTPTQTTGCEVEEGYSRVDTDCDDTLPYGGDVQDHVFGYPDEDGDDLGTGAPVAMPGCELVDGYANNNHDCDDDPVTGGDVGAFVVGYVDEDRDGIGTDVSQDFADCLLPDGFAPVPGDCLDDDPTLPLPEDLCYTPGVLEDCGTQAVGCRLRDERDASLGPNWALGLAHPGEVTRAGDFDGDGVRDLFVGSVATDLTPQEMGQLTYGEAGTLVDDWGPPTVFSTPQVLDFGKVRGQFADYDGDGQDDLVISNFVDNQADSAHLWILQGGAALTGPQALTTAAVPGRAYLSWPADPSQVIVGYAMTTGQLVGDGAEDIVLTAPAGALESNRDSFYVVEGGALDLAAGSADSSAHPSVRRIYEPSGLPSFVDQLGIDVAIIPDLEGTGDAGLAVTTAGSGNDPAEVLAFRGSDLVDGAVTSDIQLYDGVGDRWGTAFETTPRSAWADLDRSGYPDLVFAVPDGGGSYAGRVYVQYDPDLTLGHATNLLADYDALVSSTIGGYYAQCGRSTEIVEDILGIGSRTVAVGCYPVSESGRVYLFPDATLHGVLDFDADAWAIVGPGPYVAGRQAVDAGSHALEEGGDLDGDGQPDLLMSNGLAPVPFLYARAGTL